MTGRVIPRLASAPRDLAVAICGNEQHSALADDVDAQRFAEAIERLRGPSPSARLGMTRNLLFDRGNVDPIEQVHDYEN